jgi:ribonuclease-3
LAQHGRQLDLGKYLLLSRGEDLHGGRERASALADSFEAVLGRCSWTVVLRPFEILFCASSAWLSVNFPSCQPWKTRKASFRNSFNPLPPEAPCYEVVSASGPDHDRIFECTVLHNGIELARGQGKSKKAAESEAALVALLKLRESKHGST